GLQATWQFGFAGPSADTITAVADGHVATASLTPGTGFAYYNVGFAIANDSGGFEMANGPNGTVYYDAEGPSQCTKTFCFSPSGALGKLDAKTGATSEITLPYGMSGLLVSSDGAVWMAGGESGAIYRLPPGQFTSSRVQTIAIPTPSSGTGGPRAFTQDGSGRVWFDDNGFGRIFSIPVTGPFVSESLTPHALPNGPPGTSQGKAHGQGMAYGKDGKIYVLDAGNGAVDQVDPATGSTTKQVLLPQQIPLGSNDDSFPRFIVPDGSGAMYFSFIGQIFGTPQSAPPGIDTFAPPNTATSAVTLFRPSSGSQPDSLGANGPYVYYADLFGALGLIDTSKGNANRLIPTQPFSANLAGDVYNKTPNGISVQSDGTAWFTCYGFYALVPLCLGHTVYLAGWSAFPGPAVLVYTGAAYAQGVGIMEAPTSNSGPFQVTSEQPSVCAISDLHDHNFVITGSAAGFCVVKIADARGASQFLTVNVRPAAAAVKPRRSF
ncbi:MAG: hypothetical protein JO199_04145, partial [Candidatus Eremiobacteraeota bacterium]|nr:hypothetical protein [Candidatus Eremiobacteraeota bacterium]